MSRAQPCAIVLIGLLSTAGCLGFLGAETTPTPATPAPTGPGSPVETTSLTETTSSTGDTTGFPPETKTAGFVSAQRIANTHRATLRNTSFTIRYREVRSRNGTVVFRTVGTLRYDGGEAVYDNYTTVDTDSGTTSHVRLWRNETTGRQKVTTGTGTVVESVPPVLGAPTYANGIEIYMQSFSPRASGYSQLGGDPVVRVSATELTRSSSVGESRKRILATRLGVQHIIDGSFSADVSDGAVRRYRVRFVGRVDSDLESRIIEVVFTNVGTTSVPHPAWVTATNGTKGE